MVRAAQNPINLDERQVNAVAARVELDLRIGYAFSRFSTLSLQTMGGDLGDKTISYGKLENTLWVTYPDTSQDLANFQLWASL